MVSLRHIVIYDIGLGFMNILTTCQLMNKQFVVDLKYESIIQLCWNIKQDSYFNKLQENGAEFRATEATGDIRCEVCEVSVNSSHQLQAHMTGGHVCSAQLISKISLNKCFNKLSITIVLRPCHI